MSRTSQATGARRTSSNPGRSSGASAKHAYRLLSVIGLAASLACGSDSPDPPAAPTPPPAAAPTTAYLAGAGDIADCTLSAVTATAKLLDSMPGTVFTLGDNVYPSGTAEAFANCYGPNWGRHLWRTRPVPGNHDYDIPGAGPYFDYFGAAAGSRGAGYYAFDAGNWRVLALNTNIPIGAGSPQHAWVQFELSSNTAACTLVLMHHPLFSSSQHGPQSFVKDVWKLFYQYGVELALAGHDHSYERFAPQDPEGRSDLARGVRAFVVGTGGGPSYSFTRFHPNSEARASEYGVLRLTLGPTSYSWQFIPIAGRSFSDSGSGTCR